MPTETLDICVEEQVVKPYQAIGIEHLYDAAQKVFGISRPYKFIELARELDRFKPDHQLFEEISGIPVFLEEFRKKPDEKDFRKKLDSLFDLPEFVFHEQKAELENADLSQYRVLLSRGTSRIQFGDHRKNSIYRDAPYNFLLVKDETLLAGLGFETCDKAILIEQIQGVAGRQKQLSPIKWPRALIRIATNWAVKNNVPQVYVLPAERNKWKNVSNLISLNSLNVKLFYDVSAKREGFRYDAEKQVYVKKINLGGRE